MILLWHMIHTWCFSAFPGLRIPLNKRTHPYLAPFIYTWFCWQGPFHSVGPSPWGVGLKPRMFLFLPWGDITVGCASSGISSVVIRHFWRYREAALFFTTCNSGVTQSLVQSYPYIQCWFHFCLLRGETNSEKSLRWGLELSFHSGPVKKG